MIQILVTRKAYNKIKKRGETTIQNIQVPSTLRPNHKVEIVFPSKSGKHPMNLIVKVLARVKMEFQNKGICHLTLARTNG